MSSLWQMKKINIWRVSLTLSLERNVHWNLEISQSSTERLPEMSEIPNSFEITALPDCDRWVPPCGVGEPKWKKKLIHGTMNQSIPAKRQIVELSSSHFTRRVRFNFFYWSSETRFRLMRLERMFMQIAYGRQSLRPTKHSQAASEPLSLLHTIMIWVSIVDRADFIWA